LLIIALSSGGFAWLDASNPKLLTKAQAVVLPAVDAYSLEQGSSVRLMGVPVGYIRALSFNKTTQTVNVAIQLYDYAPELPPNAVGTIVSSGLGGSKSIDFSLPTLPNTETSLFKPPTDNDAEPSEAVQLETPLHQQAFMQYQIDVAKALQAGAEGLSEALSHSTLAEQKALLHQGGEQTAQALTQMMTIKQELKTLHQQLQWLLKRGQQFGASGQLGADKVKRFLAEYQQDASAVTSAKQQTAQALSMAVAQLEQLKNQLLPLNNKLTHEPKQLLQWQAQLEKLNTSMAKLKQRLDSEKSRSSPKLEAPNYEASANDGEAEFVRKATSNQGY
jgi:ABC-type transporter Mla subunit MlaD